MNLWRIILRIVPGLILLVLTLVFYNPIWMKNKLPVPSDALVGLYHPWRDYYIHQYPRGMPFKNFLITDPVRQIIPWRKVTIDQIKQLHSPGWNPYSFAGTPLSANIQTAAYYPLNILFMLLDFPRAWTILIVSQTLLAGGFMYLYLRNLGFHTYSKLFGSLAWSYCGFFVAWLEWGTIIHTVLWLPLMLLAIDKIISGIKKWQLVWFGILTLSLCMSVLAGHIQIAFYCLLFGCMYAVYIFLGTEKHLYPKATQIRSVLTVLSAYVVMIMVSLLIFLPFIRFFLETDRISQTNNWLKVGWFLPWQHLVQFVIPDFFGNPTTMNYWGVWNYGEFVSYIGLVPLLFAVSAIRQDTDKKRKLWIVVFISTLIFILPNPISSMPYSIKLPVLSVMQPTRLLVITQFSLIMLAVYGFNDWMKGKSAKFGVYTVAIVFLLLTAITHLNKFIDLGDVVISNLNTSLRNMIFPIMIFVMAICVLYLRRVYFFRTKSAILPILLLGITVIDLFRFGWKFLPFTDSSLFFPSTETIKFLSNKSRPFRIAILDSRILPPETSAYFGLETISGYDPVYSQRYAEFIAAMERGKADITSPTGFERIIQPTNINSPLFRLLQVRYVLSMNDIQNPLFNLVFTEGQTKIYEYKQVLPRLYLISRNRYETDSQKIIQNLYRSDFDPSSEAIVETHVDVVNSELEADESAEIIDYRDNSITVRTNTQNSRLLYLGLIYNPDWRVLVDNVPTIFVRANYIFSSVIVPQGTHTIKIFYNTLI